MIIIKVKKWELTGNDLMDKISLNIKDDKWSDSSIDIFSQSQDSLDNKAWVFAQTAINELLKIIELRTTQLSELCNIEKGSSTGLNKVFIIQEEKVRDNKIETDLLKKYTRNSDIDRYSLNFQNYFLIYSVNCTDLKETPHLYQYLFTHKQGLKNRNEVKKRMYHWTRLERPRTKSLSLYEASEKIITPYRSPYNKFAYDNKQHFGGSDTYFIALKEGITINLKYILAILNSKLLNFYYHFNGKAKGNVKEYFVVPLSSIPIKLTSKENEAYNKIIEHVDEILIYKEQENLCLKTFSLLQKTHSFDKKKSLNTIYNSSNYSLYKIDKTKTLYGPSYEEDGVVNRIFCRQRSNVIELHIIKEGETLKQKLIQIYIDSEEIRDFFDLSINSFLSTIQKKKFSKKSLKECLSIIPIYHKVANIRSNLPHIMNFMNDFKRMFKSEMNKSFPADKIEYELLFNISKIKTKILQITSDIDNLIYNLYDIDDTSRETIESMITSEYFDQK